MVRPAGPCTPHPGSGGKPDRQQFLHAATDPTGYGTNYRLVSNPYITGNETSAGWTLSASDALGRTTAVDNCAQSVATTPSPFGGTACNSTGTATTQYGVSTSAPIAATTAVADEDGKVRTIYADGLGCLMQVTESGNGNTTYSYDTLDDLTGVIQPNVTLTNGQSCSFTYSSVKRLTSALNPETGLICYTYDANGNLASRTHGGGGSSCPMTSGVLTSYTYDPLDQMVTKSYNDGTPTVTYAYNASWLQSVTAGGVVSTNAS